MIFLMKNSVITPSHHHNLQVSNTEYLLIDTDSEKYIHSIRNSYIWQ